jgi:ABC-type spermidine/putrescine transport system permease subunit II
MKLNKILLCLITLAIIGPIVFVTIISIQMGCYLCFDGELSGGWQELVLNVTLLMFIVSIIVSIFYLIRKRK